MSTYISKQFYNNLDETEKYLVDEVVRSEAKNGNLIKFRDESEIRFFTWGDAILSDTRYEGSIPLFSVKDLCVYTYREVHHKDEQTFELFGEQNIKLTGDPTIYWTEVLSMINKGETGAVAYINKETKEGVFSYISDAFSRTFGRRHEEKTTLNELNAKVEELAKTVNVEIKTVEKEPSKISKTIENFKNRIAKIMGEPQKDKGSDKER